MAIDAAKKAQARETRVQAIQVAAREFFRIVEAMNDEHVTEARSTYLRFQCASLLREVADVLEELEEDPTERAS